MAKRTIGCLIVISSIMPARLPVAACNQPSPGNQEHVVAPGLDQFHAPPWPELSRALVAARDDNARHVALDAMRSAARHMRSVRARGYGERYRYVATELKDAGDAEGASRLLEELIADPESLHDRTSAMRMLAQIRVARNDLIGASAIFREALEISLQNPDVIRQSPGNIMSIVSQFSIVSQVQGREEDSLWANSILTGEFRHLFEENPVKAAMGSNAAICLRLGRGGEALAWLDRLFDEYPDYGLSSHRGLGTRMLYLRLQDPTRSSDSYLQGLLEIWNNPGATVRATGGISVGQEIAQTHLRRERRDLCVHSLLDLKDRLLMWEAQGDNAEERELARDMRAQTASHILDLAIVEGDFGLAWMMLEELDDVAPLANLTPPQRNYREHLRERVNREMRE